MPSVPRAMLCPGITLISAGVADTRPDEDRPHQSGKSTRHVDNARAREVDVAVRPHGVIRERGHPAVAVPRPVDDHGVNQRRDEERVDEVRAELRALAIAPETIVAAVAAKANWNIHVA